MNVNLAKPYGKKCSPPQREDVHFYSMQSEDLLFNKLSEIQIVCAVGVRAMSLDWTLSYNSVKKAFSSGDAKALTCGRFLICLQTKDLKPGFYDLRVKIDLGNNEEIETICVFGWKVEGMETPNPVPSDFDEFWDQAKREVDQTPCDVKIEDEWRAFKGEEVDEYNLKCASLPKSYNSENCIYEEVESCKISFQAADGKRVYAWLAKPKGEGPFPAMLILPGAGYNSRPRPLEHARLGFLAIDIQIHGQDVVYDDYPQIDQKINYSAPAKEHYYYNVHQRVYQAINVLGQREDVDSNNIIVLGGSQGGRLTTVAAGLDSRVKAAIASITHFGNQPYFRWAKKCNELEQDGVEQEIAWDLESDEAKCLAYYDPMSFATRITCPMFMIAGLIDPVSAAAHVFGVYNQLKTNDKMMVSLPGRGHDWDPEADRIALTWLKNRIK